MLLSRLRNAPCEEEEQAPAACIAEHGAQQAQGAFRSP